MSKVVSTKDGDPYAESQVIDLSFPYPFIQLCKMLQVQPIEIILGLVYDIASKATVSNGLVHQPATEYFLARGYGQELFTREQVRQMMTELGTVMGLFNAYDKSELKYYQQWDKMRQGYFKVWEMKWAGKMKTKPQTPTV